MLCLMTRKLFALAKGECVEDNPDSLVNQEVLTPGQLFLMYLKVGALCPLAIHLCSGMMWAIFCTCSFSWQLTVTLGSTTVCLPSSKGPNLAHNIGN